MILGFFISGFKKASGTLTILLVSEISEPSSGTNLLQFSGFFGIGSERDQSGSQLANTGYKSRVKQGEMPARGSE